MRYFYADIVGEQEVAPFHPACEEACHGGLSAFWGARRAEKAQKLFSAGDVKKARLAPEIFSAAVEKNYRGIARRSGRYAAAVIPVKNQNVALGDF